MRWENTDEVGGNEGDGEESRMCCSCLLHDASLAATPGRQHSNKRRYARFSLGWPTPWSFAQFTQWRLTRLLRVQSNAKSIKGLKSTRLFGSTKDHSDSFPTIINLDSNKILYTFIHIDRSHPHEVEDATISNNGNLTHLVATRLICPIHLVCLCT